MRLFILLILFSFNGFAFDHTHEQFSKVLKNNTKEVEGQVLVNYKQLKKHPEELLAYIDQIEDLSKNEFKRFSKNQKLAFWINAYNAYTLQIVIKNYPVKSIKDIGSIFSSTWNKKFINILDKKMSLDDIEHNTIRKKFKEPRIHFAVNCASLGCASLLQEAYNHEHLNAPLDLAAKHFLNNKSKNFYNSKEKAYYLSKIFNWYGADFNAKYKGYVNFVRKYIKAPKNTPVEWNDYNWELNDLKN